MALSEPSRSPDLKRWIHNWRVDPSAACRLFCFPYAGGNANVYRPWQEPLARVGIEVCPLELPGRLARLREPGFSVLEPLVEQLAEVLAPALSRPFAFVGYSMGALIAFELTRYLRRHRMPGPVRLLVAARPAPQLPSRGRALHELSDQALLAEIGAAYGALPEPVLADATFRAIVVEVIRNDLRLLHGYSYREETPLECPIVALGGNADPTVSIDELGAWQAQTENFRMELFEGGHFFLNPCRGKILEEICRALAPCLARPPLTSEWGL